MLPLTVFVWTLFAISHGATVSQRPPVNQPNYYANLTATDANLFKAASKLYTATTSARKKMNSLKEEISNSMNFTQSVVSKTLDKASEKNFQAFIKNSEDILGAYKEIKIQLANENKTDCIGLLNDRLDSSKDFGGVDVGSCLDDFNGALTKELADFNNFTTKYGGIPKESVMLAFQKQNSFKFALKIEADINIIVKSFEAEWNEDKKVISNLKDNFETAVQNMEQSFNSCIEGHFDKYEKMFERIKDDIITCKKFEGSKLRLLED